MGPVPYAEIDCVFLDVGNTLLSVDFAWIRRELAQHGVAATAASLERAEARGRPALSRRMETRSATETEGGFRRYVHSLLSHLPEQEAPAPDALEPITDALVGALRKPGHADRLWSRVMAGVPAALERLRGAGFPLYAVSNADGSVERGLTTAGLRPALVAVLDSQVVGFEKPDPRIFEAALALSGSAPERTLHVGDFYAIDVRGARAAGVHPVLLDPFGDWGTPDCDTLPDLAAVADRLLAARS